MISRLPVTFQLQHIASCGTRKKFLLELLIAVPYSEWNIHFTARIMPDGTRIEAFRVINHLVYLVALLLRLLLHTFDPAVPFDPLKYQTNHVYPTIRQGLMQVLAGKRFSNHNDDRDRNTHWKTGGVL